MVEDPRGGWYVVTKRTGRKHSLEPLSKETALAQMKALYLRVPESRSKKS